jgi:uncharacterized lipoprotein YajG
MRKTINVEQDRQAVIQAKNQNIDRLNHADISNPLLLQVLQDTVENFYQTEIHALNIEFAVRQEVENFPHNAC